MSASTLYRFRIALSDVDRGVYESLDFRVAMHPSETEDFLLTRVIAYALNYESGLEFSTGLSTPDEPAIRTLGDHGEIAKWIDIGNPAPRRMHKAAKAAKSVLIYTYKSPEQLKRDTEGEAIHRSSEIEIYALAAPFLKSLTAVLKRDNHWTLMHNEGELVVTTGEETIMGSIEQHRLG